MVSSMVSQGSGRSTATLLNLAVVAAGIAVVCNAGRKHKASSTRWPRGTRDGTVWRPRDGRLNEGLTPESHRQALAGQNGFTGGVGGARIEGETESRAV